MFFQSNTTGNKRSHPGGLSNTNELEVDVPLDGNCLFWAVGLAYLLPHISDSNTFRGALQTLVGPETFFADSEAIRAVLLDYDGKRDTPKVYQGQPLYRLLCVHLRGRVVNYLRENRTLFEAFPDRDETFDTHVARMGQVGEWGGEWELIALSHLLAVNITVQSQGGDTPTYGPEQATEQLRLLHTFATTQSSNTRNHYRYYIASSHARWYTSHKAHENSSAKRHKAKEALEQTKPLLSSISEHHYPHVFFISHRGGTYRGGTDKADMGFPLQAMLSYYAGENIAFFDQTNLVVGQQVTTGISLGVSRSKVGIVILGKDFFSSKWCVAEVQAFLQREARTGQAHIIPLFYGLSPLACRRLTPEQCDIKPTDDASRAILAERQAVGKILASKSGLSRAANETKKEYACKVALHCLSGPYHHHRLRQFRYWDENQLLKGLAALYDAATAWFARHAGKMTAELLSAFLQDYDTSTKDTPSCWSWGLARQEITFIDRPLQTTALQQALLADNHKACHPIVIVSGLGVWVKPN